MANQNPYVGKITNTGAQIVKSPMAKQGNKGNTKTSTGNDLRSGKK